MNSKEVEKLLKDVKRGDKSIEEALDILKNFPYTDLGFARIDNHREMRTGYPEIIYCAGKSIEQVQEIFRVMSEKENNVNFSHAIHCRRTPNDGVDLAY